MGLNIAGNSCFKPLFVGFYANNVLGVVKGQKTFK